jgi:tryptophanyl-tRNA synthetase
MSKSDPSDYSRINLTDEAEAISQKIRKARTDPEPLPASVEGLEGRAEAQNLVGIYAALAGTTAQQVLDEYAGQGFGAFKPKLADLAVSVLGPIGGEMRRLLADPAEIDRVLADGARRARQIAAPTMAEVRKIVGFWNS